MEKLIDKAKILLEALPYIKKFFGKTMVIKIGGEPMVNDESKKNFALNVILLKYVGINPVIVHGGGQQISAVMKSLGKEPKFIDGLRVTDRETINITEMVLTGQVNKEIVSLINYYGGKAVGISGKDGSLIKAKKITNKDYDLGYVGEIEKVNPDVIFTLDSKGFIPVISPIAEGENGEALNVNADTVASHIAVALKAEKLIILSNVKGIYTDPKKENSFASSITEEKVEELIKKNIINKGMLPKVKACIYAIKNGVAKTHIINGLIPHSILLEIFTESGIGTQII